MEEKTKRDLDQAMTSAIAQHAALPIYLWSLDGEISGRGPGSGWLLQLHFEDSTQEGGVRHVTIGFGDRLNQELADQLKGWLLEASQRRPGKQNPRIELYLNS